MDRSTRPITLTTAGEVFLEEVQQALLHLDRAIVRSQQASKGQIGHLTVGVTNGVVTLLSLVVAGVGLAILPNHVKSLQREGVVYRSLTDVHRKRQVAAA